MVVINVINKLLALVSVFMTTTNQHNTNVIARLAANVMTNLNFTITLLIQGIFIVGITSFISGVVKIQSLRDNLIQARLSSILVLMRSSLIYPSSVMVPIKGVSTR